MPIGPDRYELYCEVATDADISIDQTAGLLSRLRRGFREMLHAAEERQHRRHHETVSHAKGWLGRAHERIMAWVAERIAEQRLLWHLRGEPAAVALHPDDLTFEQVQALIRRMLQRDYDRHRVWLMVDTLGMLVSIPLTVIPGPNVLGMYFTFRVVGHWLSMRGASQGLHRVVWSGRACPPLTDLRRVAVMPPGEREQQVHAIAARLRLHRFSIFFERVILVRA